MGIPRFYRWLKGRYPLIRMDLSDPEKQTPIFDNFYIDFNAIIYQCIRQSGCFLKNKVKPLTLEQIYQRVEDYLLELVRIVNPQKLLFIGFDGVAPRAKINQSRDRRFRSGIEDIEFFQQIMRDIGIVDKQNFEANSISPGTEFLFNLCQKLKIKVQHLLQTQWKGLHVLYSDCCVPGEGEHKIMDFIRYSKTNDLFTPSTTHCVYSPDADVILLTLALDIEYIAIIKQDTTQLPALNWTATSTYRKIGPQLFELVFINILREYFIGEFSEELKMMENCSIQDIIDDFVLLMAFIGNDFLPTEFCFKLNDQHMDALFDNYRQYLKENKTFINNRGTIDWKKVTALLKVARHFQANRISQLKGVLKEKRQQRFEQKSVFDDVEKDELDHSELQKFQIQDNKIVQGIGNYYKSRFNITDKDKSLQFVMIIKKYIEGLQFYCQYYYKGLPSWNWFYPFHYTPLLSDVYDYLCTHNIQVQLEKSQPFDPILALCFMLPEHNFGLLPNPLSAALKDRSCPLRHPHDFYPNKFQLDRFQSLRYHKRALILFLKEDEVRKVYDSVPKQSFSKHEKERNQKQNTILFFPNKDHFGLFFVTLEPRFSKDLKQLFKDKFNIKLEGTQKRFPSLQLYNPKFQLNIDGKIIASHKYNYTGNPTELVFFNNFIGFVERQQQVTPVILDEVRIEYNKKACISDEGKCKHCYVVKRGKFVMEAERDQVVPTRKEVLVPDFALCKAPNLDYLPQVKRVEPSQRYHLKQRVVVLSQKYFGCSGWIEELGEKVVKVRLTEDPIKSESKIEQIDEEFFTVKHIMGELDISKQTLFSIISEVILLPIVKKKQWNERLPSSLNFGLNFIDIPNAKIVPRFVRINFQHENTKVPQRMFDNIQFSATSLALLRKYMTTFPWLIELLEEWKSPKLRKQFKAKNVFGRDKDPNTKLYQQFIKLYELDTKGTFCSFYSKTADIYKLPKMYTEKKSQKAIVSLGYHQIISRQLGRKAPPSLKYEPEYHDIGSRVVLLRSLQVGYVICVDDLWVHVAVGKEKRRVKVLFTDAFSEGWSSYLNSEPGKCWNSDVSYYTPTHWKAAIGT